MSNTLQSVKKKIYAVCPGLCPYKECDGSGTVIISVSSPTWPSEPTTEAPCTCKIRERIAPLGLPEVLRAINARLPDVYSQKIKMGINEIRELLAMWNLLVNLDGQSEEVWKFLDGIL